MDSSQLIGTPPPAETLTTSVAAPVSCLRSETFTQCSRVREIINSPLEEETVGFNLGTGPIATARNWRQESRRLPARQRVMGFVGFSDGRPPEPLGFDPGSGTESRTPPGCQLIARDALGTLTKLGKGGQGIVYQAPKAKTKFADRMVFKEYKPHARQDVSFEALSAMPTLVEENLPNHDGQRLVSIASWPCALVENDSGPVGFLMPAIPASFYIGLTTVKGRSQTVSEFQHLLNPPSVLIARGIAITNEQRYQLLREVANGLSFLHRIGVCVGDISPKNVLFSLNPHPAVYFVDCDAMRVNGVSALPQMETPEWDVPTGEELATIYSDTYKLGLLALRLLVGDQHTKNPQKLPHTTPKPLRLMITDTLLNQPASRPNCQAWGYILKSAIEEANSDDVSEPWVRAKQAIPTPDSKRTTTPKTPRSRPQTKAQAKPAPTSLKPKRAAKPKPPSNQQPPWKPQRRDANGGVIHGPDATPRRRSLQDRTSDQSLYIFVAAIFVAALVLAMLLSQCGGSEQSNSSGQPTKTSLAPTTVAARGEEGQLPVFKAAVDLGANCQYPAAQQASRKVDSPNAGKVPTDPATISVSMSTDQGNIGLLLNNAEAPCTVNSFASLAQKGFFDDTVCHRLTTAAALGVLQCGDPSGTGSGGPGYQFANEYPTNQYPGDEHDDPALRQPLLYPRGTLAMANAGPDTNGSQFFLVYKDSKLPPNYTVFGTIDATGLATLDKIAGAGVAGGGEDGEPATDVKVKSILLD